MTVVFYLSVVVALAAALMVVTRRDVVHALLYLVMSLLALSLAFYALGAPFAGAIEVIIYAGAIMVLFIFIVMTLNLRPPTLAAENQWLSPQAWAGPAVLAAVLLAELIYGLVTQPGASGSGSTPLDPAQVGLALVGPYVLGTELASMLLLAGLVGAYHLGRPAAADAVDTPQAAAQVTPTASEPAKAAAAGGKV